MAPALVETLICRFVLKFRRQLRRVVAEDDVEAAPVEVRHFVSVGEIEVRLDGIRRLFEDVIARARSVHDGCVNGEETQKRRRRIGSRRTKEVERRSKTWFD